MGARGAFSHSYGRSGGIPKSKREYSIVGNLFGYKVIQCDTKSNNPAPVRSNARNNIYFSYNKMSGLIEHIYYYRNHKLVKSIDFRPGETPHTHKWNPVIVGRKRHDSKNHRPLDSRDQRLLRVAQKFNKTRNKHEN